MGSRDPISDLEKRGCDEAGKNDLTCGERKKDLIGKGKGN